MDAWQGRALAVVETSARAVLLVVRREWGRSLSYLVRLLCCLALNSRLLRVRPYQSDSLGGRRIALCRVDAPLPSLHGGRVYCGLFALRRLLLMG